MTADNKERMDRSLAVPKESGASGGVLSWRDELDEIRRAERGALLSLLDLLAPIQGVAQDDLARLRDAIGHLGGLFHLVVLGEFNAGKSAFINGLLGAQVMPEGVTPTTTKLHLVTYGPEITSSSHQDEIVEWTFPADWLRGVYLVDTPGSNSLFRQHEDLARRFIHWGDLVFFVMAANRAFAETDRLYLGLVREFRSKVVLIINQTDLLTGPEEIQRVARYVSATFRQVAGFDADVYPVSARLAQDAAAAQGDAMQALWDRSGYEPVCDLIKGVVGERDRARGALLTSCRVSLWAIDRNQAAIDGQIEAWRGELDEVANIRGQWDAFAKQKRQGREAHLAEIGQTIGQIHELALERLNHDLTLGDVASRIWQAAISLPIRGLRKRMTGSKGGEQSSGQLERYLRLDAPEQIQDLVGRHYADIRRDGQALLTATTEHIGQHLETSPAEIRSRVIGKIGVPDDQRRALIELDDAGRQVQGILATAGIPAFVQRWAASARSAWWQVLFWEVVVVVATWASSSYVRAFADERGRVLGWIVGTAVVLGIFGLLIVPFRRLRARRLLADAIEDLQSGLGSDVASHSDVLIALHQQAMEATIAPFARLVQSERGRVTEARSGIAEIKGKLQSLADALSAGDEPAR